MVQQILLLLNRLCPQNSDIPLYNIIFNFENDFSVSQYIFENYIYKESDDGLKIRGNYIFLEDYENKEVTQMADLCYEHELVINNVFNNNRFTVILDTKHKPYISNFFDYIIESYIGTKKYNIEKLLECPDEYKSKSNFFDEIRSCSIFDSLNCEAEEEILLSRAVSEFFYCCYDVDVSLITMLTCQEYEGGSNKCNVYIPRRWTGRGKRTKGLKIKLREPVKFSYTEVRRIRKFMEMAKDELNLVLNREKSIIGFTDLPPNKYEGKLVIQDKLCWDFHLGDLLLKYIDGVYRIRNINKVNLDCELYNSSLTKEQNNIINMLIYEAKKQHHGTIIIFGDNENVKKEAKRLSKFNRCIMISPFGLIDNLKTIINITSIDGALLVDFNGICYAIGAILDGDMEIKGNTERGSRYNSAINYVERQKKQGKVFISVIFSEDGAVDIYPNEFIIRP